MLRHARERPQAFRLRALTTTADADTSARLDAIVADIYAAAASMEPWTRPLARIAEALEGGAVRLHGVAKAGGATLFLHEAGEALEATVFSTGIYEDESCAVYLEHAGALEPAQRQMLARLGAHLGRAFALGRRVSVRAERESLLPMLLERMRHAIVLLDGERRISYANEPARRSLARGDVFFEHHGLLLCREHGGDLELTAALRELGLASDAAVAERRALLLRRGSTQMVVGTLLALRPREGSRLARALLTIHGRDAAPELDPFVLATTFELTPAESRVAARLAAGLTIDEISREANLSANTVRSQLKSIFEKTGTSRQTDLVRLILSACAI